MSYEIPSMYSRQANYSTASVVAAGLVGLGFGIGIGLLLNERPLQSNKALEDRVRH